MCGVCVGYIGGMFILVEKFTPHEPTLSILKTKWSLPLFSFSHPFPPPAPREHQQIPLPLRNLHSRPQTRTLRPPWPPPGQSPAVCVWRNKKVNHK